MLLQLIYGAVIWVIVPSILASIFFLGLLIIVRTDDDYIRVSARAGFLAGLLVFVIYVVARLPAIQIPQFGFGNLPNFTAYSLVLLALGGILGFFLLRLLSLLMPTRFIGVVTLILAAASSSALFSYLFDLTIRYVVMYFALGLIFGILIHIMFYPESIEVLRREEEWGVTIGIIAILLITSCIVIMIVYLTISKH
jgi:hypothetical protein